MFPVACLYDYNDKDALIYHPFQQQPVIIDDPNRLLTSNEVKQSTRNMTICEFGVSETSFDLERASKAINYLMELYPFFSYGVKYDENVKWMRYVEQPVQKIMLSVQQICNTLQDMGDIIASASQSLNSQKLIHWEVVNMNVPEMPTVKQALVVKIFHTLVDAMSIMQLFKRFNEIYSDKSFDFSNPVPVQLSNYRPIMSFDQNLKVEIQQTNPLKQQHSQITQITGQFKEWLGSNQKQMEDCKIRCRYYKKEDIAKINNVKYSFSLYAMHFAQIAAYAYFNKDLEQDQKFIGSGVDLRREKYLGNIDFDQILGQSATYSGMLVSATTETTVQQLANQLQNQYDKAELSSEKFWLQTCVSEMGSVRFDKGPNLSLSCSNLGKMNLGEGPIIQMIGYSSHTHVWDKPMLGFANTVSNGKLGMFIIEWDLNMFSEQQQVQNSQIFKKINRLIAQKGAENVLISDIIIMYKTLFTLSNHQ
ncbi:Conserved_hypothetical protein [Hexamita inflata]|uniref:Uncharacterized protein n=1 Tax=Hexamita inflata TaxID=28002 RepID=A0AA86P4N2_9EUKA|nr:Conserved hypothetical protein [Hexamita inflata]